MSNARYNLFPSKPAFFAKGGGTQGVGTGDHNVIFDSAVVNFNSCYSTSTGRFTAPVAGSYFFAGNMRLDSANVDYFRLRVTRNGNISYDYPHSIYDLGHVWDPRYFSMTCSGVIYLEEDDYTNLLVESESDTSVNLYRSESSFTGFLVS